MPSPQLDHLTAEFPAEREALNRLFNYLESARPAGDSRVRILPVNRLYEIAGPSSPIALTQILARLVATGMLKSVIRFETDALSGAKEFQSIEEIPAVIHDESRDLDVEVRPENLRLYYKF